MKNIAVIMITVLLASFSCEKKDDILTTSQEKISGNWNWLQSIYHYTTSGTPYVLNPDSLGYHITHVYTSEGEYMVLRNGEKDTRGVYWFDYIEDEHGSMSPLRLFTQLDEYIQSVNYTISGDTLILDESEIDGPVRYFLKEKED
jgi:hypothetical protein